MTDLVKLLRELGEIADNDLSAAIDIADSAAARIEALEAALRNAHEAIDWHSDEKSRASIAEIEKVLK